MGLTITEVRRQIEQSYTIRYILEDALGPATMAEGERRLRVLVDQSTDARRRSLEGGSILSSWHLCGEWIRS